MPSLPSARPSHIPFGFALAALSVVVLVGGLIIWAHQDPAGPPPAAGPGTPLDPASEVVSLTRPVLPSRLPIPDGPLGVHSITLTQENGTRVVKIQVVPGGDEIVVDAVSGRVMETRPGRSGPGPTGKVAAPLNPMT